VRAVSGNTKFDALYTRSLCQKHRISGFGQRVRPAEALGRQGTASQLARPRTGVVSAKYVRFGRIGGKVAKAERSSEKICTPPGGEVIAKICVLRSKEIYTQ